MMSLYLQRSIQKVLQGCQPVVFCIGLLIPVQVWGQQTAPLPPLVTDSLPSATGWQEAEITTSPPLSTGAVFRYPAKVVSQRIAALEGKVPLRYNRTVQKCIDYLTITKRSFIETMLARKDSYLPIFEAALKRHGLPLELQYLPIIESGLNPKASSSVRAVGLWQFMPEVGKEYGLYQDAALDERMDPYKSSEAACLYLKWLYERFRDWELVLAAYNSGVSRVRRAQRQARNGSSLQPIYRFLPHQTRTYVPMFVAVRYVMHHHESYNLRPDTTRRLIPADTIQIHQRVYLPSLAQALNISLQDLKTLNPHIKSNWVAAHQRAHTLQIPLARLPQLAQNRKQILLLASSAKANSPKGLPSQEKLAAELPLAQSAMGNATEQLEELPRDNQIVYSVRKGDVIGKIAAQYGVKETDILKWNRLRNNTIQIGQRLVIHQSHLGVNKSTREVVQLQKERRLPAPLSPKGKVYLVQKGDTLWDISKMHGGVPVKMLKKWNKLPSNKLKPGQKLIVG
jgi:membrane-bound lytic murein transglycosylase D